MSYDLIAIGETMIALAPPPGESVRTAPALLVNHAGAESNTCVGLARLGLRAAWISRLGTDAAGDRIVAALTNEGVDTQWVRRDPQRPTGLMIKEPGAVPARGGPSMPWTMWLLVPAFAFGTWLTANALLAPAGGAAAAGGGGALSRLMSGAVGSGGNPPQQV